MRTFSAQRDHSCCLGQEENKHSSAVVLRLTNRSFSFQCCQPVFSTRRSNSCLFLSGLVLRTSASHCSVVMSYSYKSRLSFFWSFACSKVATTSSRLRCSFTFLFFLFFSSFVAIIYLLASHICLFLCPHLLSHHITTERESIPKRCPKKKENKSIHNAHSTHTCILVIPFFTKCTLFGYNNIATDKQIR